MINGSVRDGGISPRGGWQWLCRSHAGDAFYQGGFLYEPIDGSDPYLVASIGGRIYKFDVTCGVEEISATRFVQSTQPAVGAYIKITNLTTTFVPSVTITAGTAIDSPTTIGTLSADFVIPAALVQGTAELTATATNVAVGDTFIWHVPFGPPGNTVDVTFRVDAVSPAPGVIPPPPVGPPVNPTDVEQAFFCQAEQFLIIQASDGVTLPLFWDGSKLRRSIGINDTAATPGTKGVNEIPAATCMDYYMGRLWYAQGTTYGAGDIVGGNSGTLAYGFKDAILNVTENPLVVGGDNFNIPSQSGSIRALKHNENQDSANGQGLLYIFTRKSVFALQVPVSRSSWIRTGDDGSIIEPTAGGAQAKNLMPLQTVIQNVNGAVSDRSVVGVNGDLYYQSLEPAIRSILNALRYFNQPGNRALSANEQRILQFCDRGLLRFVSGIEFDNRLLMSSLPKRLANGIVSQAIIPMDFVPISSFGTDTHPIWEGMYEGLDILQLFTGNFSGVQRAFALVVSPKDGSFNIWELDPTGGLRNDLNAEGENRITMTIEFPAFTWANEFLLKKVVSNELWIDRLYGTVDFTLEFRPDGDPCWHFWTRWQMCSARNCTESVYNPCAYPSEPFGSSYRSTITTPKPPPGCQSVMGRPAEILYQCQTRLTVKGFCRIRGSLLKAYPVEKRLWSNNPV